MPGIEILVRLVTTPAADGTVEAERMAGSIILVKEMPCTWGAAEGPPNYGVLRVNKAVYDDFEDANRAWMREWLYSEGKDKDREVITIVKSTPTIKAEKFSPLDIFKLASSNQHESVTANLIDDNVVISYIPKTPDAKNELLVAIAQKMAQKIRRRRYRVPAILLNQLRTSTEPHGLVEVDTVSLVDIANDAVVDRPSARIEPIIG